MRLRMILSLAAGAMLIAPAAASADFAHTVLPGESLSSVAATDGLSIQQLASANGISSTSPLIAGSRLMIPPQGSVSVVGQNAATGAGDGDNDLDDGGSAPVGNPSSAVSSGAASGSYVVQPGDTLSGIAARAGMSIAQLAASNGLNPSGLLISGSVLHLGGGSAATPASGSSAASSQPVGSAAQGVSGGPPYPTPERVTPSEVGQIAAANGVPPSLAEAIGFQESGFNNDLVSSADARGVMQILPGTWNWIGQTMAGPVPLSPASAASNVLAGVLLLHSLLSSTGGDPAIAAAGYYQGLPSVLRHGMYSDTRQYVNDVMALRNKFGG